jgi:hypothetical protein
MKPLHHAFALVMLLSACSPRDAQFNPSHFHLSGAAAPPDVVLPTNAKPGATFGGIVMLGPKDETICCPAGAHLDVPVRKDGAADALVLGIYLTEDAAAHQIIRVTFPDGTVRTLVPHMPEFSISRIPLPAGLRKQTGILRIRIDATRAPYTLASIYFE